MSAASRPSYSLLKRAWNEIPDIVGGSVMLIIGLGLSAAGVANYYARDGENPKYKIGYVVMRSDDPRVEKIRKD